MLNGPEHNRNWRIVLDVDGYRVEVSACHSTVSRMPRGNEMILNAVRGRLHSRIEETKYLWQVSYNDRFVTSLRQLPNGYFHSGSDIFARMDIEQAATSAFKLQKLPSRTVPASVTRVPHDPN